MKKIILGIVLTLCMMLGLGKVMAVGIDSGINISISTESFAPRVFMDQCSRVVLDDYTEPGAISGGGEVMVERINNYAFEGEQVVWDVLVWDKNGVEKIGDTHVNVGNNIEANCVIDPLSNTKKLRGSCGTIMNLYEGEELIAWNDRTMKWYTCTLTVETPESMRGQYVVKAEAEDQSGANGTTAESETWFLNPVIALGINGNINFGTAPLRAGGTYKSSTLTIGNAAQTGSGVLLDMYIAGTDFYDASHTGAMCPTTNKLALTAFRYYASNGAYTTCENVGKDAECYDDIPYYMTGAGAAANNNMARIIDGTAVGSYPLGNVLSPGAEISINFKLKLPEPCNGGSFTQGQIKIFGEAV